MDTNGTAVPPAELPPDLVDRPIWAIFRDALKRVEKEPLLRARIRAFVLEYFFILALGGGRELGRLAGVPEPPHELPDLRRSRQVDLSGVTLALEYEAEHEKAKRLFDARGHNTALWQERLLKEFPSLMRPDLDRCKTASATAYMAVARRHHRAPDTVKHQVRTLPRGWGALVRDTARALDEKPETIRALVDSLHEWNSTKVIKMLKKASTGRTRPRWS
jgi:hypothetical protein